MFTVLPMSQTINLKAGEVFTGEIQVANPADATADFRYEVAVAPYSVIGEDYTADLGSMRDSTQIVDWISIEEPMGSLKPNEVRSVKFKIAVPSDAPAGGQYAAITVRSAEDFSAADSQVNNIFEIASVLFAGIEGETVHSGEILENAVPSFSANNPAAVSVAVKNTGNVHEAAVVKVAVKNVLTGEVLSPEDSEGYVEYIMPGTTRNLTREVTGLSDLGIFEVTQTVEYLGESSVISSRLVMCPIWFMGLAGVTIFAIIFAVVRMILKRKA